MSITLGFDVYGTLIDTAGTSEALAQHVGESAAAFASLWRSKQLEYAFRRALMNKYRDFAVCTRQALDYACLYFQTPIAEADRKKLMERYLHLPAFPDAKPGLARMKAAGFRLIRLFDGPT
jgi:2-haloacid dehalogenase